MTQRLPCIWGAKIKLKLWKDTYASIFKDKGCIFQVAARNLYVLFFISHLKKNKNKNRKSTQESKNTGTRLNSV